MLKPFDLKAALLAKHAQHVVLIHLAIALFLRGTLLTLSRASFVSPISEKAHTGISFCRCDEYCDRRERNSRLALGSRRTAPERHPSVASLARVARCFCALWLTVGFVPGFGRKQKQVIPRRF